MQYRVLAELKKCLPPDAMITDEERARVYECDGLSGYRQLPACVLLPETVEQVQAILRICYREKIPVVARGAGTGLSGGALPVQDGVVLGLARFNRILDINPLQRSARVQSGVVNISISEAASCHGLYYAPDPSSQIACTIGGNVAENAGGVHCLKYGLTVHNILALKMVTAEGDVLEIGSEALDTAGYDLSALLTGSEGMLGIIVEVTVKLLPKPPFSRVLLASFAEIEAAGRGVADIIANGIVPAGLEMMDKAAIGAVEAYMHVGYPVHAAAILLCEIDGVEEEVKDVMAQVAQILRSAGADEVRIAKDASESERFWAGRKAAFPAVGRLAPDYYCMDGTIPRKHIASVLNRITTLSGEYGLGVVNVFHAGDGNLHPLILYDVSVPGEFGKAEEFGGRILEVCVEAGGTITGEHGVGVEKINQMCIQFTAGELTQFHAVKTAFDARGILNPGKAVPTLRRCAEFGAIHVRSGRLPFADIERF
ncbi:MAG: glycolate oxidase subunit GlcD [Gammaproteobacteria bacterium RBG_16_51_14]|nr:MAG: glycolate oxidase subunit GlcD [Gammaproteobacteria bacterium RBG_16_51_14]